MTHDLHIRHCDIRIRRHAGDGAWWVDERGHRALAQRVQKLVLQGIDELVAPYLSDMPAMDVPSELSMELILKAEDLAGAAPLTRIHLRNRIRHAFDKGRQEAIPRERVNPQAGEMRTPAGSNASAQPNMPAPPADPLALLLRWYSGGQLTRLLATLSPATLADLLLKILLIVSPASSRDQDLAFNATDITQTLSYNTSHPSVSATDIRTALIELLKGVSTQYPACGDAQRTSVADLSATRAFNAAKKTLLEITAASRSDRTESGGGDAADATSIAPGLNRNKHPHANDLPRPGIAQAQRSDTESIASERIFVNGVYSLDNILPFLLLQPLARHGIVDAMTASGSGPAEWRALIYAMALRTCPAPEQASRWDDTARYCARMVAASAGDIDGMTFKAAAKRSKNMVELVEGGIAAALIGNLRRDRPLPVIRDGDHLVVFDPSGLYPICRCHDKDIAALFGEEESVFFLTCPDPPGLAAIDASGLDAIARGAPARGERWTRICASQGWVGMVNQPAEYYARFLGAIPTAERTAQQAEATWHVLTRGPSPVADPAHDGEVLRFERTASMLAGFALADIGWALFRRDNKAWTDPDPVIVIERFHDLSGSLEVTDQHVTVALPLGARFADLRDAGLLETLPPVPWWPGRTIRFRGG